MNITILGYTGSGKTTYLSAVLSRLFDDNVNGFRLTQENNEDINAFDVSDVQITNFNNRINSVYTDLKFPPATDNNNITIIPCNLICGKQQVLNFNIIDYPGGRLKNISQGDKSGNLEKLANLLFASDVAIVFIDAEQLSYFGNNISIARNKLGVNYIRQILVTATKKAKESNRNLHTMFVLSKIDSELLKSVSLSNLKNKVADLYSNFFAETGNAFNMTNVIELGVIGYGNVKTVVNKGISYINTTNEIISMKYTPINVVSILAKAWILAKDNINCDIRNFERQIAEMKLGALENIIDILFRHSRKRNAIREKSIQLDSYKDNLMNIETFIPQLEEIISNKL